MRLFSCVLLSFFVYVVLMIVYDPLVQSQEVIKHKQNHFKLNKLNNNKNKNNNDLVTENGIDNKNVLLADDSVSAIEISQQDKQLSDNTHQEQVHGANHAIDDSSFLPPSSSSPSPSPSPTSSRVFRSPPRFPVVDFSSPTSAASLLRAWELSFNVQDFRHAQCMNTRPYTRTYPPETRVAVIIPSYRDTQYHLMRTVSSLVTHTNPSLLAQIIVIDDTNDPPIVLDLDDPASNHASGPVATRTPYPEKEKGKPKRYPFVTVHRLPVHGGLTVSKNTGARIAINDFNASHIIFLEAHIVAQPGWLEPLLSVLIDEPDRVVVPIVDNLEWPATTKPDGYAVAPGESGHPNFNYSPVHAFFAGEFGWDLMFRWIAPKNQTELPINFDSAGLSGGLYGVASRMYSRILMLDDGLTGWGAENVELAIKAWNCAAGIKFVPCSRIGHMFRSALPYAVPRRALVANMARIFLVWMGNSWMDMFLKHYNDQRYQVIHVDKIYTLQKQGRMKEAAHLFNLTSRSDLNFVRAVITDLLPRQALADTCLPFSNMLDTQVPQLRAEAVKKREEDAKARAEKDRQRPKLIERGRTDVQDDDVVVAQRMGRAHTSTWDVDENGAADGASTMNPLLPPQQCATEKVLCIVSPSLSVSTTDVSYDDVDAVRASVSTWARSCAGLLLLSVDGKHPDGGADLPYLTLPLTDLEQKQEALRHKFAIKVATKCFFMKSRKAGAGDDEEDARIDDKLCQSVWLRPDVKEVAQSSGSLFGLFSWLLSVDSSVFVIQEHLCGYLSSLSSNSVSYGVRVGAGLEHLEPALSKQLPPLYVGRRLRFRKTLSAASTVTNVFYASVGYALNAPALLLLDYSWSSSSSSPCSVTSNELGVDVRSDVLVGACLLSVGVDAIDTRTRSWVLDNANANANAVTPYLRAFTGAHRFHVRPPGLVVSAELSDSERENERDPLPLLYNDPFAPLPSSTSTTVASSSDIASDADVVGASLSASSKSLLVVRTQLSVARDSVLFSGVGTGSYVRSLHTLFTGETPDQYHRATSVLLPSKRAQTLVKLREEEKLQEKAEEPFASPSCPSMVTLYTRLVKESLSDPLTASRLLPASASVFNEIQPVSVVRDIEAYIASVQNPASCASARALVYDFDRNFQEMGASLSDVFEAFSYAMAVRRTFVFSQHKEDGYHFPFLLSNCTDDADLTVESSTFECLFARRLAMAKCSEVDLRATEEEKANEKTNDATKRIVYYNVPDRQWRTVPTDQGAFKEGVCDVGHSWPLVRSYVESQSSASASSPSSSSSAFASLYLSPSSRPPPLAFLSWRASLINAWFRPRLSTLSLLALQSKERMGWPVCDPVVGLYVGGGAPDVAVMVSEVKKLVDAWGVRYVYLSTEEESVMTKVRALLKTTHSEVTLLFDPVYVRAGGYAVHGSHLYNAGHEFADHETGALEVLKMVLLADTDFLVGHFSSFTFRIAYLAKAAQRNYQVTSLADHSAYPDNCVDQRVPKN